MPTYTHNLNDLVIEEIDVHKIEVVSRGVCEITGTLTKRTTCNRLFHCRDERPEILDQPITLLVPNYTIRHMYWDHCVV